MRPGSVIAALWTATLLCACSPATQVGSTAAASAAPVPNQLEICNAVDWRAHPTCSPGQKIAFLPDSWGNEQLPVMFAAVNCDLRHAVVITKGPVTCIFMPAAKVAQVPESPGRSSAASAPKN